MLYDDQRMMYFIGCPDCKRKISQERQGLFRCEICNKTYPDSEVRITYTLTAKFSDLSDSAFVSLIGESGDQVVGVKAADFRNLREVQMASPDQLRDLMNHPSYSYHTMVVRAKVDDYQSNNGGSDEIKFRYQAVRVTPIDFKEDNEQLLKRLEMYKSRQNSRY